MWTCKKCKEENEDSFEICWNCGQDSGITQLIETHSKKVFSESNKKQPEKSRENKQKYPALFVISKILKVFAWVILISSIIFTIIQFVNIPNIFSISTTLFIGIVSFLVMLASSELIILLIDIEKNTRNSDK